MRYNISGWAVRLVGRRRSYLWLSALSMLCAALMLAACSRASQSAATDSAPSSAQLTPPMSSATEAAETSVSSETGKNEPAAPVPGPVIASSAPASPYGPPTLDEIIFATDVIAIVRPVSSESAVLTVQETEGQAIYSPVVQSQFEVVEYLKGGGDSEIVVNANNFSIKSSSAEEALQNAKLSLAAQISSLDGEEGLVFIQRIEYPDNVLDISLKQSETGWRQYNVQTGLFSTRGDVGSSSATLHIASGLVAASARGREAFSIGRLRDRIEAMEDLLKKGEGIEGYEECIEAKLLFENFRRKNGEFLNVVADVATFPSGMPANFIVQEFSTTYPRQWFTGDNAQLFHYGDNEITTTRPLPAEAYEVDRHFQKSEWMPCDYVAPPTTWRYTFESADGVVHEAFFDPVALGDAVGADGASGVLKPVSFAFDGSDATIQRIDWLDGQARMSLSPHTALANHHIDFIALDGSVSLRLDFDDAVEVADADGSSTLAWGVCSQPWQPGDLLMLRISESPADLAGVTFNAECAPSAATASPTPTPEVIPADTPVPTPTAAVEFAPTVMPNPEPKDTAVPTATPTPAP